MSDDEGRLVRWEDEDEEEDDDDWAPEELGEFDAYGEPLEEGDDGELVAW